MDNAQAIEEQRNILWSIQRSQRYHARRSSFFSRWNKSTAFAGIVGGSAVFASLGEALPSQVATVAAALVVIISGADLVIGASDMARTHNDLRRRFCELEAEIVGVESPCAADIGRWKAARISIESNEPTTHVALNILCHNELVRGRYEAERAAELMQHVGAWRRLTAHLFVWENT